MSRAVLCLVASLSVIPATCAYSQTPQRDRPIEATGTAVIRGRVLDTATGDPVRKVRVRAAGPGLPNGRGATTDAEGRYELKTLPAGRFTVTASKPAYVNAAFGQTKPTDPGAPLEIADGQTVDRVDIRIARGGVVAGRIVDETGEPVEFVQVALVRFTYVNGERRPVSTGGRMTNDAGEFRIFGVVPGQYYLSATFRSPFGDVTNIPSYTPTYFPGTGNVGEAQPLTIAPATVLTGMNVTLLPIRAARVSGTALDSSERPMASGFVTMSNIGGPGGIRDGSIKPDGSFSITNVPPGVYQLRASAMGGTASAEIAAMRLTVDNVDVDNVRLVAVKPTRIAGRITIDPGATRPPPALSAPRVYALPADNDSMGLGLFGPSTVKDDATFEVRALPARIAFSVSGLPSGWGLKLVRFNGRDITDTGVDIGNEPVAGVEMMLTDRVAELSGRVLDANGQPVRGASVLVFTQDRSRWHPPVQYAAAVRASATGEFTLPIVRGGALYVVAVESLEQGEHLDTSFLDRIAARASKIDIAEGERKRLDLTVSQP